MKYLLLSLVLSIAFLFGGITTSFAQPDAPAITSFTPISGAVGATITITGTNFNTTPENNVVFFGATQATVSESTGTSLTVTVPPGATYAPITVLNTGTALAAYSLANFNPTFSPNTGHITTADIAVKVDFTTGTNPFSVAIGDIDGDGKPDLALANYLLNTISFLRNSGSGNTLNFAEKVDFTTGTIPKSVAFGDIDGDGKLDLAVTNYSSETVSVFRNTCSSGTVSFAEKVDFTTGIEPISVAICDMDGDGKLDLAVANYDSNTVSVLRNTGSSGTISFAEKVDFTTGTSPKSVAIGDMDGDGKLDLAVANIASNTVSVLRNTGSSGTISFAEKVDFTTGTSPISVAIGDMDGDGKLDLAVANIASNTVSVLHNTGSSGTISFAEKVDFTTGSVPRSVAIGDMDGDDKLDLAVANKGTNTVSVLCNTGSSGTLDFAEKVDFTTGTDPYSVAIGDIDGNGKPDLAVANFNSNSVSVLRNSPALLPTVTTQAVSDISTTIATGNGDISDLGVPNPTAHGVCWNTSGTPTTTDDVADNGAVSTTGAFTASMSSLTAGTIYYVRAYATNSEGTSYGAEVSFTTLETPTVTTQAVSGISTTTATGNGDITDLGVPNPTAHGVCWNTTGTPTTADDVADNGAASTTGAFTASMTSLTAGTLYYVRAYATNSAGTSYGSEVNFTTLVIPTIAFNAIASSGLESANSADLQVDLSTTSGSDVTVDYAVTGTATGSGTDYTLANGTLTILAGNTTANITIASIVDDALVEGDETVIVTLSNPSNASLGTNTIHTYTINDNDNATNVADIPINNLSVYPNPCTDNIHFENINSDISYIILYDLCGQSVLTADCNGKKDINVSHLRSGVYLLTFINNKGGKQVIKFVKE